MFRSSLGRNWKRWSKLYSHQFSLVTPSRRGLDQLAWSTNFNSTRSSIMVFLVFLFTTKERLFRSIDKTSRKGPTKWVAKEKTEWNNQNWPLLCGFWIVLKLWWRHPTAANRIHSAIKQSTLKTGWLFVCTTYQNAARLIFVCTHVGVIFFIYFEKLFISLMNSVYKELHGKHARVHSFYILMLLSIPSIPILVGHLSSRAPFPTPFPTVEHFSSIVCLWVGNLSLLKFTLSTCKFWRGT